MTAVEKAKLKNIIPVLNSDNKTSNNEEILLNSVHVKYIKHTKPTSSLKYKKFDRK